MPEETHRPKTGHEKGDVKVRDMKPDKDPKGGGKTPVSGGDGGKTTFPVPPTTQPN
jgi:hypothetical protein